MSNAQKRAIRNYRARLGERGLARFEVVGLAVDRDLIRALARHLAEEGPAATRLRATLGEDITGTAPDKKAILVALRRSPLVGADLDLDRRPETGRAVVL